MADYLNPAFRNENKAREYLEAQRWPNGVACVWCGEYKTVSALPPKGSMGPGWYHCRKCRDKFTVRVGTLYERSHVPLHKWLYATHLLCSSKKGISSHQLSRMLGVTYKTAWFMAHRIREGMKPTKPPALGGEGKIVEADATFQGKRDRRSGRSTFVTGFGWVQPPPYDSMRKVFSLVERGGAVRSFHVDHVDKETVFKILFTNADRKSELMTDEAAVFQAPGFHYKAHFTVNHSEEEYVRSYAYTNTIEGFFSIFKRGMKGIYQHCGSQHLHRYLAEYDFRYSNRQALGVNDEARTKKALQGYRRQASDLSKSSRNPSHVSRKLKRSYDGKSEATNRANREGRAEQTPAPYNHPAERCQDAYRPSHAIQKRTRSSSQHPMDAPRLFSRRT